MAERVGVKLTIFLIIPLRRRLKAAEEALACLLQRFEPEPGSIPVGTIVEARRLGPRVLPGRPLFYFAS
jgi:hypothetical protein